MDPANPFAAFSSSLPRDPDQRLVGAGHEHQQPPGARRGPGARAGAQLEAPDSTHVSTGSDGRAEFERRLEELSATEVRATMLLHVLQSFYFALGGFASSTLASLLGAVLAPIGPDAAVTVFEIAAVGAGTIGVAAPCAALFFSCARRASPCALSRKGRRAFARGPPATTIVMIFGPASPDLLPGARNAVDTCLAIQPGERVTPHRRPGERRGRGEPGAGAQRVPRRGDCLSIEALASEAAPGSAARSPGVARRGRRGHPLYTAAGRRTDGAAWRSSASSNDGGFATRTWSG